MTTLNVHRIWHGRCPLLGPAVYVWVQGCPRRCPGCFNVEALDARKVAHLLSPEQVAARCTAPALVLSGGEPFAQPAGLARLCRLVRAARPGVRVLSYTGHRLESLLGARSPDIMDLLRQLDVLIDGPYDRGRSTPHPLMGSANQRVLLLSSRVEVDALVALRRALVQVEVDRDRTVRLVGTGSASVDMHALVAAAEGHGIRWDGIA